MSIILPDRIYESRLFLFSEQMLGKCRTLERIARDLPVLTRIALDPAVDADLRSRAGKVCREHTRSLEREAEKLEGNLKQALPGVARKQQEEAVSGPETLQDIAVRIAEGARNISERIHTFLYPDRHTVDLEDLRNPGLLGLLRSLRNRSARYRALMQEARIP